MELIEDAAAEEWDAMSNVIVEEMDAMMGALRREADEDGWGCIPE